MEIERISRRSFIKSFSHSNYNKYMPELEISPLYINPDDDRAAVEALIRRSEGAQLLLIFAGYTASALDMLDLRLLQRRVERQGKQLAIATRNAVLRDHAEHLGIPHFRTPAQARREAWGQATPEENNQSGHTPINECQQPQRYQPSKHIRQWWEWGLSAVVCLLSVVILLLLFSRATVTIVPQAQTQSLPLEVTASSDVRAATLSGEIPLRTSAIILDSTAVGTATGNLSFPEGYAEGFVTVTNLTSEKLDIPAGLTIQTIDLPPVQFITNSAISLAPAGEEESEVRVAITAHAPGRDGNVNPGEIRAVVGEFGSAVAVNNAGAMFGGYNRFVNSPSVNDVEALRANLTTSLMAQAQAAYATQMTEDGFVLLTETIQIEEVLSEETVPTQGEPAETFHMTLRVRFTANYLDPTDLEPIAGQLLDADLEDGYTAKTDTLTITPIGAPILNADGTYQWMVFLYRSIIPDLNQMDLQPFAGQSRRSLTAWLNQTFPELDSVTIKSQPWFWWRLPILPQRMEIIIL